MKHILWILAGIVFGGALILTYCFNINAQRQEVDRIFTLNVTGLPPDLPKSGHIWGSKRLLFGGYRSG